MDVANATDYLRFLTKDYPLNLSEVLVTGHSAGGHLALWLATRHKLKEGDELFIADPLPVIGAVLLAGIPDIEAAIEYNVCDSSPILLMGGYASQKPERYREGSPRMLAPLSVPQIFITGKQDPFVPIAYVRDYIKYAKSVEDNISSWEFDNAGHFEVIFPDSEAGSHVTKALEEILTTVRAKTSDLQ